MKPDKKVSGKNNLEKCFTNLNFAGYIYKSLFETARLHFKFENPRPIFNIEI